MSRTIASFLLAVAIGMFAGVAAAQAPGPDALLAEAGEFSQHGQYEQAIAAAEKALAAAEKSFGPEDPLVLKVLKALAGYHELKGEPARALPLYRRALAIAEKAFGPGGSEVAELKTRIADAEKKTALEPKKTGKSTGAAKAPRSLTRSLSVADAAPPLQHTAGAATRSFNAAGEEGGTIPVFPWPPPTPSAEYVFPPEVSPALQPLAM